MCVRARVRGTVWCVVSGLRGVLIGPLIVWNRTNKCVRVSFVSFCVDVDVVVKGVFRFLVVEIMFDLGVEMACDLILILIWTRCCIQRFIVICWLKASVSINMLYMVIVAPVLKPWTFWLKAAALLNMSSMVIMAPVSTPLMFWLCWT